jgi:hypothetical protein
MSLAAGTGFEAGFCNSSFSAFQEKSPLNNIFGKGIQLHLVLKNS